MKTAELTGRALDYAAALAENYKFGPPSRQTHGVAFPVEIPGAPEGETFTAYFGQSQINVPMFGTGPAGDDIIDREGISVVRCNDLYFPEGNEKGQHWEPLYKAFNRVITCYGPDRRTAAMRCWVASKLGAEVDIPEELQ